MGRAPGGEYPHRSCRPPRGLGATTAHTASSGGCGLTRRPALSWSRGRRSRASAASSPPAAPPRPWRRSWRRRPSTWRAAPGGHSLRGKNAARTAWGAQLLSGARPRQPPLPGLPAPSGTLGDVVRQLSAASPRRPRPLRRRCCPLSQRGQTKRVTQRDPHFCNDKRGVQRGVSPGTLNGQKEKGRGERAAG